MPVSVDLAGIAIAIAIDVDQPGVVFLEGVGDVLEEDQAEDDVLVLRGVHVVAQLVGGEPTLGLEADGGGGVAFFGGSRRHQLVIPSGRGVDGLTKHPTHSILADSCSSPRAQRLDSDCTGSSARGLFSCLGQ